MLYIYIFFNIEGKNESSDASGDLLDDSLLDVESGVEALEGTHLDVNETEGETNETNKENNSESKQPYIQKIPSNFSTPPNKNVPNEKIPNKRKTYFINFFMTLLTVILFISYIFLPNSNLWIGFVLGLWMFYFMSELKHYILDTYFCDWDSDQNNVYQFKKNTDLTQTIYTIPSIKEHRPLKKYEVCFFKPSCYLIFHNRNVL